MSLRAQAAATLRHNCGSSVRPTSSRSSVARRNVRGPTEPAAPRTALTQAPSKASATATVSFEIDCARRVPTLRHIWRSWVGRAGTSTDSISSSRSRNVLRYPQRNSSTGSSRAPRRERSRTRAPSATSAGLRSAAGEAVPRLPPSVARA